MNTMAFFLWIADNFNRIEIDSIIKLSTVVKVIKESGDIFSIPTEFYSKVDANNKNIYDVLDTLSKIDSDAAMLLSSIIFKNKTVDESYEDLFDRIDNPDELIGFVTVNLIDIDDNTAADEPSLRSVYRFQIHKLRSYSQLFHWVKRAYPELLFTEDAFNEAHKIGNFTDNADEINKVLAALNDHGKKLYRLGGENEAISSLQMLCGVNCSGKGANESSTFKKTIKYKKTDDSFESVQISCIPHFKLETRYSDKRIYYCWGRSDISNHAIIVVHIGCHWDDSINSKMSALHY